MSWYRDDDGKIITDEEFEDDCCNCSAFCSEGTITVPCNGERTDCPYFKEVDTCEYDKEIRAKALDEFAETLKGRLTDAIHQKVVESMTNLINDVAREVKGRWKE